MATVAVEVLDTAAATASDAATLRADAPAFVPGAALQSNTGADDTYDPVVPVDDFRIAYPDFGRSELHADAPEFVPRPIDPRAAEFRPASRFLQYRVPAGAPRSPAAGGSQPKSGQTTVMLKNVPGDLLPENLLPILDNTGFRGTYDYLYLPADAATMRHKGYAFVNFMQASTAQRFMKKLEGSPWSASSPSRLSISYAQCQGVTANLKRQRDALLRGAAVPARFAPWVRNNQ